MTGDGGALPSATADPQTKVNGHKTASAAEESPGAIVIPIPLSDNQETDAEKAALRQLLERHPYVDRDWYLRTYDDVRESQLDPIEHYIAYGAREKRAPNRYFNAAFYRANAPHAVPEEQLELLDYHDRGWWQGAQPSADFDTLAYLEAYADVAAAGLEPLAHYLGFGADENRSIFVRKRSGVTEPGSTLPTLLPLRYQKLLNTLNIPTGISREFAANCLHIAWIVPDFEPGAGGHMAIFKAIYWLEYLGHEVSIWIDYPHARNDATTIYEEIIRYFRPVKANVRLLDERSVIRADVVMATDHQTVWSARKHASCKQIFYFVQDFEPLFFGAGSEAIVADKTYDLSLFCFCSSPWLAKKMRERGSPAVHFYYPADADVYFPAPETKPSPEIPLIAFYARIFTSRRAVELALLGLTELARRGERFRVALFGQRLDESSRWPFPVEFYHVLSESELANLYRRADIGVVFSTTNYSIAAVEMMACGLPVVDLKNDSTLTSYPSGIATLVEPLPETIADGIKLLLDNREYRAAQIKAAREWVSRSKWPEIGGMIAETIVEELKKAGFKERQRGPAITGKAFRVSVVIPTFNAGNQFGRVLDRVLAQAGPFEADILCIDSGSTDYTVETIAARETVRLIKIPNEEFNHGGTRNLGVENCDSDYVAFLTQDALPASERWLFDLAGAVRATPGAALGFGRHLAYPSASPFVRRDLDAHFNTFKNGPLIVNMDTDRERFEARDESWFEFLRYNSDNNSCISRRVWETLPLPVINFGEDQLWAWQVITAGYSKIYVDAAAVYHSHNYDAEQTRARARTESGFFKQVFGVSCGIRDKQGMERRLNEMNRRDMIYALKNAIPRGVTETQFGLNRAQAQGYLLGESDGDIVYKVENLPPKPAFPVASVPLVSFEPEETDNTGLERPRQEEASQPTGT
jgi:glycosyltransferase involved in cell wall biosynthesis